MLHKLRQAMTYMTKHDGYTCIVACRSAITLIHAMRLLKPFVSGNPKIEFKIDKQSPAGGYFLIRSAHGFSVMKFMLDENADKIALNDKVRRISMLPFLRLMNETDWAKLQAA